MEMTFYARGDSLNANNAALNVLGTNGVPTTELVFSSGLAGDIVLDYNNGDTDPDTVVFVDGVEMTFTVEFSGTLPIKNKLVNVNGEDLRGEEIVVVTVEDGTRFFFLTNGTTSYATMDAFPKGAHAIGNLDHSIDVLICFLGGTLIRTPSGDVPVENLKTGDLVINGKGDAVTLRWISSRKLSNVELMLQPKLRPVCLPEGSMQNQLPHADLWLSPLHRVVVAGWQVELMFSQKRVFAAAKHLFAAPKSPRSRRSRQIEYFHLLFDEHEVIFANGLETESLYPGDQAIASMTDQDRVDLRQCLRERGREADNYGPTALPTITGRETMALRDLDGLSQRQSNSPERPIWG